MISGSVLRCGGRIPLQGSVLGAMNSAPRALSGGVFAITTTKPAATARLEDPFLSGNFSFRRHSPCSDPPVMGLPSISVQGATFKGLSPLGVNFSRCIATTAPQEGRGDGSGKGAGEGRGAYVDDPVLWRKKKGVQLIIFGGMIVVFKYMDIFLPNFLSRISYKLREGIPSMIINALGLLSICAGIAMIVV